MDYNTLLGIVLGKGGGGGGSALPEVTDADDGKVLSVVDGQWDTAEPGTGIDRIIYGETEADEVRAIYAKHDNSFDGCVLNYEGIDFNILMGAAAPEPDARLQAQICTLTDEATGADSGYEAEIEVTDLEPANLLIQLIDAYSAAPVLGSFVLRYYVSRTEQRYYTAEKTWSPNQSEAQVFIVSASGECSIPNFVWPDWSTSQYPNHTLCILAVEWSAGEAYSISGHSAQFEDDLLSVQLECSPMRTGLPSVYRTFQLIGNQWSVTETHEVAFKTDLVPNNRIVYGGSSSDIEKVYAANNNSLAGCLINYQGVDWTIINGSLTYWDGYLEAATIFAHRYYHTANDSAMEVKMFKWESDWSVADVASESTLSPWVYVSIDANSYWMYRAEPHLTTKAPGQQVEVFEMIYKETKHSTTITDASGSLYRSALTQLNLPSGFETAEVMHATIDVCHNNYPCWGTLAKADVGGISYYAMSGGSRTASPNYLITAELLVAKPIS